MRPLGRLPCLIITILMMSASAVAQPPPPDSDPEQAVAQETVDVFDLLRKLRHKDGDAQAEPWDYRKPMMAFAPVIGAKPSSGVLFGAAGNMINSGKPFHGIAHHHQRHKTWQPPRQR